MRNRLYHVNDAVGQMDTENFSDLADQGGFVLSGDINQENNYSYDEEGTVMVLN